MKVHPNAKFTPRTRLLLVRRILQENWSVLGKMTDGKKAMDILAQQATTEVQSMLAGFLPQKELPVTPNIVSSPGNQMSVTPVAVEEEPVDFVSQANAHYKL